MKTLVVAITLLSLANPGWSTEPRTVLGIAPSTTMSEAREILRARGGRISFPKGPEGEEFTFLPREADGLIIDLFFYKDGVRHIQGGSYSEGASEERCLASFEQTVRFLGPPTDLRRYRYEYQSEDSKIKQGVVYCFAEGGFFDYQLTFAAGGVCAESFSVHYEENCADALERILTMEKIPREQVTEEQAPE